MLEQFFHATMSLDSMLSSSCQSLTTTPTLHSQTREEPELKSKSIALFPFTINHQTDYSGDGTTTTIFEETPVIPTNQLAFVICDLEVVSNIDGGDETFQRVWTKLDSLSQTNYALETSINILKTLEDYVGVEFGLSKLDSIDLPQKTGVR